MSRRPSSSRFTAWAVVLLLVLRAAVPLFAVTAAQARGVPVGEVCNIYGVTLPGASHAGHAAHGAGHGASHAGHGEPASVAHAEHGGPGPVHGEHHAPAGHGSPGEAPHAGDHCALTGLASLAAPDIAATSAITVSEAAPAAARPGGAVVHDACASWAARLRHAPPAVLA